jgi:hypothetical protein
MPRAKPRRARDIGTRSQVSRILMALTESRALYRILSLDGGGTWALTQVRALMHLFGEDAKGHEVLRRFRLVVANSGGSTIAASLAVDQRLSDIVRFLKSSDDVNPGFEPTALAAVLPSSIARRLPIARFTTPGKYRNLRRELGPRAESPLPSWRNDDPTLPDLVIPAFDFDRERVTLFRTNPNSPAVTQAGAPPIGATLLDAVNASTTAPIVFFDRPAEVPDGQGRRRFWDGAMAGYNNPIMLGVIEALASRVPRSDIRVLSIGSGSVPMPPPGARGPDGRPLDLPTRSGPIADLAKVSTCIVDDPPEAATFAAHVVLGGDVPRVPGAVITSGPVVRLSATVRRVRVGDAWIWPAAFEPAEWARFATLDLAAHAPPETDLIDRLALAWIAGGVPNQPIRADADMNADIGHDTVAAAVRDVRSWLFAPAP